MQIDLSIIVELVYHRKKYCNLDTIQYDNYKPPYTKGILI